MSRLVDVKYLTAFEQAILSHLESNVGSTVRYQVLEDALLVLRPIERVMMPATNVLEVLVGRIRKKLPVGATIKAVRNVGYQLEVVGKCDSCSTRPGTRTIRAAGGTETLVCNDCSTTKAIAS